MPATSEGTDAAKQAVPVYVLYMDIVDSTRATIDRQDKVNSQLRDVVASAPSFQSALAAGEIISLPTGDGMALVFFNRWDGPLKCAIEIAKELLANPFCRLRIGIHCGPVIVENDINGRPNVSGDGISLAARVMACGGAGHILLTRNSADLFRNLAPWKERLHPLGEIQVKKDRLDVWNYVDGEIGNAAPISTETAPAKQSRATPQPSIAVLPFANMSADKEQEYFSDGLAEEIINLLAQMPGLKVIARTSAFAFRGKEQDVREIGKALGVGTIHEGSVRRAGQRVRVTAQLVSAEDGSHLFSERYDREMTDIFAVQDELAAAIAAALRIKLAGSHEPRQYTTSVPAYEAWLKARHHALKATPESLELGRQYYELAISLDPGFALPHSGLAHYYFFLSNFGRRPSAEAVPLGRAAAAKALLIDPALSEAHAMMGSFSFLYDLNWNEAELHFDRALARQPAPAQARQGYAVFQCCRGRAREAIEIAERLIEEDPLAVWPRQNLQLYYQVARREEEALDQLNKVIVLNDKLAPAHFTMATLLAARGSIPEALESARKGYAAAPWYGDAIATLAALLRLTGDESAAQALLRELGGEGRFGSARCYALFHVFCGELDAAADYVEKSIAERDLNILMRLHLAIFRKLYTSPRWPKIVRMLNLTEEVFRP